MTTTDFQSPFAEIDEAATIKQVKRFLSKTLPQMRRVSQRNVAALKSTALTGMPKSTSVTNGMEKTIYRRLYAEQMVEQSATALKACDSYSQTILTGLYFGRTPMHDYQLMSQLGYGNTRYYYYKNQAFLQFADCFLLEDLHIYQD